MPCPEFSPEQCIRIQLDALKSNDDPWPNHGLQTAYKYGLDVGGMERSHYFGFSKDLYHFDHFMGHFAGVFPELLSGFEGYTIDRLEERDGVAFAWVTVKDRVQNELELQFVLDKKDIGRKRDSWMTARLLKQQI